MRSPCCSARSASCSGLRAVATTRWPAASAASVRWRPRPRALPVINHVLLMADESARGRRGVPETPHRGTASTTRGRAAWGITEGMSSSSLSSAPLAEFLRASRARVRPADVGLPDDGRPRRVPGLRREELAQLANVSVDYVVRLEQGRSTGVSRAVLEALADALALDD